MLDNNNLNFIPSQVALRLESFRFNTIASTSAVVEYALVLTLKLIARRTHDRLDRIGRLARGAEKARRTQTGAVVGKERAAVQAPIETARTNCVAAHLGAVGGHRRVGAQQARVVGALHRLFAAVHVLAQRARVARKTAARFCRAVVLTLR